MKNKNQSMENWKYKGKLARVMQLAHLLNRPQGATIKQIMENIGYTSRTSAYYAIKALELDLDYPVIESNERNANNEVVYKADPREIMKWNLSMVKDILTEDDARMIDFMIENYMSRSSMSGIIDRNRFMRNLNLLMFENYPNLIPILGTSYANQYDYEKTAKVFSTALKASQERQKCVIEYDWIGEKRKNVRYPVKCVDTPLGIHLLSYSDNGSTSTIRLDLIDNIELKGKCDYPVTENEIKELLDDPFCIWQGEEEIICKIEMNKAIGVVESRREWGKNVTVEQKNDGKYIFTIRTKGELMLLLYIKSLGIDAKVMEPASVINMLKRMLRRELATYEDS